MIELVLDGVELDSQFLDDLWVAIRDKVPADTWVPIKKDHQRVVAGLKHIVDCRCYGEDFDLALHEKMTHFKKISAYQPLYNTTKPVGKPRSQKYWSDQDELKLENQKREYERARRGEMREQNRKLKKKRK